MKLIHPTSEKSLRAHRNLWAPLHPANLYPSRFDAELSAKERSEKYRGCRIPRQCDNPLMQYFANSMSGLGFYVIYAALGFSLIATEFLSTGGLERTLDNSEPKATPAVETHTTQALPPSIHRANYHRVGYEFQVKQK